MLRVDLESTSELQSSEAQGRFSPITSRLSALRTGVAALVIAAASSEITAAELKPVSVKNTAVQSGKSELQKVLDESVDRRGGVQLLTKLTTMAVQRPTVMELEKTDPELYGMLRKLAAIMKSDSSLTMKHAISALQHSVNRKSWALSYMVPWNRLQSSHNELNEIVENVHEHEVAKGQHENQEAK